MVLYLFAYVEEYQQIRTFAVERIESIEKLGDHFEKPSDFTVRITLATHLASLRKSSSDVEIIFAADVAEYVRSRVWHASLAVREIGGGRINLKMRAGGEFELSSWIMSFGASATVVAPERLRRRVESDLRPRDGKLSQGKDRRTLRGKPKNRGQENRRNRGAPGIENWSGRNP